MYFIVINGKVEYILQEEGQETFARLIDEYMGDDAARYFRELMKDTVQLDEDGLIPDPLKYCNGECDQVYKTKEHYENILHELDDLLRQYYQKQIEQRSPKHLYLLTDALKIIKDNT